MGKWIFSGIAFLLIGLAAFIHFWLPGLIEASLNVTLDHDPYIIDAQSARLHEDLFIADMHSDALLWKRDLTRASELGHVDLPRLQAGNVALQLFAAVTKSPSGQNYQQNTADSDSITTLAMSQLWPIRTWSSLYERALLQLNRLQDLEHKTAGKLKLITTRSDLQSVIDARQNGDSIIGGVFVIEGGHPLEGKIENLQSLYDAGMRVIGLTHFFDNELGGSLHGISGDGLSEFGRQVIARANELELIIDIAHASPQMVRDVLAQSTRPVILSHGGVKGICDQGRNLDDELMIQIAEHGGLFGVGYWDGAVCDVSPEGIVKSIRYAIDLMGEDHVALGSDYDGSTAVTLDTSELAVLTRTMLQQGFNDTEIRKVMGENIKEFMLLNLPDNPVSGE